MRARLKFEVDWIEARPIKGAELRATYAALRITIGDRVVTRVLDRQARSLREHIHLSLYPVAEWLVFHWWPLLHEPENPARQHQRDYLRRHDLRFGREGYAFPSFCLRPTGNVFLVTWEPIGNERLTVEFTDKGTVSLPREAVTEALCDFVAMVIARLDAQGVRNSELQREWAEIWSLDEVENAFCRAAGMLGCDPFALSDSERDGIVQANADIPASIADEFFAVGTIDALPEAVTQVRNALAAARSQGDAMTLQPLRDLKNELHGKWLMPEGFDDRAPWVRGYESARLLRRHLGIDTTLADNIELAQALGLSKDGFPGTMSEISLPGISRILDGALDINTAGNPGFSLRPVRETGQRFAFCRLLLEYLSQPDSAPAVATPAYSMKQRINRAFAAEFLAPAELLRERLAGIPIDESEVESIADEFGVSDHVINHQIENHRLLD